jgi:HIRAN domain
MDINQFAKLSLREVEITFLVILIKLICSSDNVHMFSENNKIHLEKQNDNPYDVNAIKVLVYNSDLNLYEHVGYVAKSDVKKIREIHNFEKYEVKLKKMFTASAELVLLIT